MIFFPFMAIGEIIPVGRKKKTSINKEINIIKLYGKLMKKPTKKKIEEE